MNSRQLPRPKTNLKLLCLATLCLSTVVLAQTPPQKKALTPAEYDTWERLGPVGISNDGHWVWTLVANGKGESRLTIRNSDGPEKWEIQNGSATRFADNSQWVAYFVNPPRKETEALVKAGKRPERKLSLKKLPSGEDQVFENVSSFEFTKGSWQLILQHSPAQGSASGDLEIVDLSSGSRVVLPSVARYVLQKDGRFLAYQLTTSRGESAIELFDLTSSSVKTLHIGKNTYSSLEWAEKKEVLVALVSTENDKKEGNKNVVLVADDIRAAKPKITIFDPETAKGFPKDKRIVEFGGLAITEDGSSVAFGIADWKDKEKDTKKIEPDTKPNVEVWSTLDVTPYPLQKNQLAGEKNRNSKAVWLPADNKFSVYADDKLDSVRLFKDMRHALAVDSKPYETPVKKGGIEYSDLYLIDTLTAKKTKLMEKGLDGGNFGVNAVFPSPEGKWLISFRDDNWWIARSADGVWKNVTAGTKDIFYNDEDDHTIPVKPFGVFPNWLKNDEGLVLYGKYDAYLVKPETGAITKLTDGAKDKLKFHIMDVGYDEDGIRLSDPMYFAVTDDETKSTGIYRREPDGTGKILVLEDSHTSFAARSKDTDRVLFVRQSFTDSPTAYLTNLLFSAVKPIQKTNPQQEGYNWGKEDLISYKDKAGHDLKARLVYPANYKPGQYYPMIVSIYERQSDSRNVYTMPSDQDPYNVQRYSQEGYFVLLPDIAYKPRNPGLSALECVETAVKTAISKNVGIDRAKLGLCGHSWGAYETAFIATQSKMFSAYVAGAPLTELMSMYNSFYWNGGQSDQVIFESSQGRMGVPWWEDLKAYLDNSPVQHAASVIAPIMIVTGDKDGAVDWHQSLYFYQTMRRMGKKMVMLVYPEENHFPSRKANQIDFAKRTWHFFDVYLKGVKAEKWVTDGVPATDMEKERERNIKAAG